MCCGVVECKVEAINTGPGCTERKLRFITKSDPKEYGVQPLDENPVGRRDSSRPHVGPVGGDASAGKEGRADRKRKPNEHDF